MYNEKREDWDDLDIYDRESADIRRALRRIDLKQWVADLNDLDPDLFENLQKLFAKDGRNYR